MFCPKCGTKAIEGAAFCQKCGARLIRDDEPAQNPSEAAAVTPQEPVKKVPIEPSPVKQPTADRPTVEHPSTKRLSDAAQETSAPTTAPTSGNGADVYVLLKENIAKCPSIKAAKQAKNGVYLQGKIHNHFVTIASGQAGIGCSLAFPLSILYYLFGGSLAAIAVNIGWNAVDYGFYWESFYTVLLVVGLLSLGLALVTSKFCGIQEKADVEVYVQEILDSQGITLTTRAKKQSYSGAPQDSTVKKKSWKLPVILGVVVLAVVLVFTKRTGIEVKQVKELLQSEEHPFMLANLDGTCEVPDVGTCIFEAKTASAYKAGEWEDTIPDEYMIQVQHYMAVTGYAGTYIAVLIGGNTFKWRFVERDEELISMLIELETVFWNHVQDGTPPPLDGSDASAKFLSLQFPRSIPLSHIALPDTAADLLTQYDAACEELEAVTEKKQKAEKLLKEMMGNNEVGTAGGRIITWKSVFQERLDSKTLKVEHPALCKKYTNTTSYRRFTIKAAS